MKVRVEQTLKIRNVGYVIVRILDDFEDFRLSDSASLGGVPIKKWVEAPRKLKEDGSLDKSIYVFAVKNIDGFDKFVSGQNLELIP
jgi:hypothetical protein